MEFASAYHALGSHVTVIEMLPKLLANEQPDAALLLTRLLARKGLSIKTNCRVDSVVKNDAGMTVIYTEGDATQRLHADVVLMAIGRKPRLTGIDSQALGLALGKGGVVAVDTHMRTNLPGVYAIGDAIGGYQLAHAAYEEAETAVRDMLGKVSAETDAPMPRCIYTKPCFAAVGMTAAQAEAAGHKVRLGTFSLESNGMALAEGTEGAVFALLDAKTTRTLGLQIVGGQAPELIAFAAIAVKEGYTLDQWERMIVAHPSLAEAVREAALDAFGCALHKVSKNATPLA